MVFCGTATALAISPAARPSGSCFTSSLNTSSRVGWASAASARMASSDSIYPELWIHGGLSTKLSWFQIWLVRQIYAKRRFVEADQSDLPRPVPFPKTFPFPLWPNQIYIVSRLTHSRCVSRSSRTRDGMRWTRQRRARAGIAGQVLMGLGADERRADERGCA